MELLSITYEIKNPQADPESIETAIEVYPSRRISNSSYVIETELSPRIIYEELRPYISQQDTLLICPFRQPWHGRGDSEVIDWISERS